MPTIEGTSVRIPRRLSQIRPSGIRELFDKAGSIPGAIDLSIGQAHFGVPDEVKEAIARAARRGCGRYSSTAGYPELCEALHQRVRADYGVPAEWRLMVTSGATGALALALLALVEAGDEVCLPDPYFVGYPNLVHVTGATPVFYDLYPDWSLHPERVRALFSSRTRVLVLNSPSNPTGACFPAAVIESVAEACAERGIVLLSDELYAAYSYDAPHASVARASSGPTILVGGFSKAYGMAGFRVGWAVGDPLLIDRMRTMQQFLYACPPTISQHAALAALDVSVSGYVDAYRQKRDRVYERLTEAGYDLARPAGSFFAFPRVPSGDDHSFCERALAEKLVVVPGRSVSRRATHFRMSFAVDDETLHRGLDILCRLARTP